MRWISAAGRLPPVRARHPILGHDSSSSGFATNASDTLMSKGIHQVTKKLPVLSEGVQYIRGSTIHMWSSNHSDVTVTQSMADARGVRRRASLAMVAAITSSMVSKIECFDLREES